MANPPPVIRIPNLPNGQLVDDEGNATDDELTFRHALISQLQKNFGNEGCVIPTQYEQTVPFDDVTKIQNNQNGQGQFTCQLGTMLYVIRDPADYTQDSVMIAVRNDNSYPLTAPLFKTVTLV